MDASVILIVAAALCMLIAVGLVFLVVGDSWAKRSPSTYGVFFPTLHLVAFVAALVGVVLAAFAFASDHPRKWLHLTMPLIFVGIVYGYALGFNRQAWGFLAKDIAERMRWRK